jgi:hypothetical protein
VWREVVETMARPHARPAIAPVTPGEILKEEFLAECLISTLADLGSVGEGIFHALPDRARNFDTISARP